MPLVFTYGRLTTSGICGAEMANTRTSQVVTGRTLVHSYSPRGACQKIFEMQDAEVLISGPAGTGKSRACLEKLFTMCLLNPGLRGLIVRKTLASLGSTALVTWRKYVAAEALATGDMVFYGGSAQEAPQYRFTNGSTVTVGGMDRPSRIMSSEYDIVYVQEATELTLEDVEYINTRLRNWTTSFQQLLMDCNPAGQQHWLKLRANEGRTILVESRHEDNPILFDRTENEDGTFNYNVTNRGAKYIAKLDKLTGVRHKRLRLGLWVSSEGIIYEAFDPAVHVLQWEYDEDDNKIMPPKEWPRYWVIDFGYVHPFVCQWWAEDPDGRLYMYREIFMTQRTVTEHAETIKEQVTKLKYVKWYDHLNRVEHVREEIEWTEPQPTAIICDHDAEGRRTLEKSLGLGTTKAIKTVHDGLDLVQDRLKIQGDGKPRLFIYQNTLVERDQELVDNLAPTCTLEEIPGYVWGTTPDGKKKKDPKQEQDDGCDDIRYMIAHRDFKGKARATQLEM